MAGGGFYGKLPSEGDFVTRRLPWEFTSAWDDWLNPEIEQFSTRNDLPAR